MDFKKYDSNGGYAAKADFKVSKQHLLDAVDSGFEAVIAAESRGFGCSAAKQWALDYLETGLKLLGLDDASKLVKKDPQASARSFREAQSQT